jgi:hypothetical protein
VEHEEVVTVDMAVEEAVAGGEKEATGEISPKPQKPPKEMSDVELDIYVQEWDALVAASASTLRRNRRILGGALFEKRERIRVCRVAGQETINWADWCASLGLDRKSAFNLAEQHRIVSNAPDNLCAAADRAGIDLFRPQVTRRLKVINEKLEGLGCTDAELPDLLRQLDGDLLRDLDAQADAAETSESASVQPKAMKFKPSKSVSKAGATVPTVTQGTITQVTISTAPVRRAPREAIDTIVADTPQEEREQYLYACAQEIAARLKGSKYRVTVAVLANQELNRAA